MNKLVKLIVSYRFAGRVGGLLPGCTREPCCTVAFTSQVKRNIPCEH